MVARALVRTGEAAAAAAVEDRLLADRAMERYAAGDETAFGIVYDEVEPRLARHLRRHLRSAAVVEDLVQQTFLHMHRARGRFIPGAEVVPWAFAIAMRLLIDGVRYEQVRLRLCVTSVSACEERPDEIVEASETAQRIDRVLARLPAAQRSAFELHRLDGLSQHETALALGTSESAVKSLVHRASEALRGELAQLECEGDAK
jgi:RNA polymerase sigma-70 factor (ECF subfamily)